MKFSYLICHSNTSTYRENNLNALIKYIRKNFNNVEIVVAEQGTTKSDIRDIDVHVFNRVDGLFERSKLLNLCVKSAKNEKLLIGDNDLIVERNSIIKSLELLDQYETVNPYHIVRDIPENVSKEYILNGDVDILKNTGSIRDSIVFAGGMLAINKSAYIKVGGYDEGMIGWGGEDDIMSIKITRILSHMSLQSTSYHLYHDRVINGKPFHEHYEENVKLFMKISEMNDRELREYCKIASESF